MMLGRDWDYKGGREIVLTETGKDSGTLTEGLGGENWKVKMK